MVGNKYGDSLAVINFFQDMKSPMKYHRPYKAMNFY